jgi:hypothetical protein
MQPTEVHRWTNSVQAHFNRTQTHPVTHYLMISSPRTSIDCGTSMSRVILGSKS